MVVTSYDVAVLTFCAVGKLRTTLPARKVVAAMYNVPTQPQNVLLLAYQIEIVSRK